MNEINITAFVLANDSCMALFSDSVANSGLEDIGKRTWQNAFIEAAQHETLFPGLDAGELVDYFASFGAWERDELEAMSTRELCALLIQFVAGEVQSLEAGNGSDRVFESKEGEWFFILD